MKLVIDIPEIEYNTRETMGYFFNNSEILKAVANGTPLTPDTLADLLMEERIRGELKQDISYSRDVIDNVRCSLTVGIIDHRPCYCGSELKEVWRERE